MAIVMAGGVLGFVGAVAAYLALDAGWLAALAIWVGSGPIAATVALALAASRPAVVEGPETGLARAA